MNIWITHTTNSLVRSTRFLGALLTAASMVPAFAVSQSSPAPVNRQTAVTLDGNAVTMVATVTAVENGLAPREFALFQSYPNPFNPSTTIQYSLENATQVSLKVYNLLGNEVATLVNSRQEAGQYTVLFNTDNGKLNLSSGVYLYRLEAGSFVSTKKLVLIK